jgi:excisionase family DNA binding protein
MDQTTQVRTIADLAGRATIRVDEAAAVLGVGRSAAFEAARRGELPVIRLGKRLLVPVPQLLALLGIHSDSVAVAPAESEAKLAE